MIRWMLAAALALPMAAKAENLCGVMAGAEVLTRLSGPWDGAVTISVEAETLSVTRPAPDRWATLEANGAFLTALTDNLGAEVVLHLAELPVYDVDAVDDLLDTTETPGIADDLSDTRCGPADLPQLTGAVTGVPGTTGSVTLIGYFDDRILMLIELERRGDWGLAFITATALLTRP